VKCQDTGEAEGCGGISKRVKGNGNLKIQKIVTNCLFLFSNNADLKNKNRD